MTKIKFEDIRVGDDITATHAQKGATVTRRGVVGYIPTSGMFYTAEGGYIGCAGVYTFTLNHRPEPSEPEGLGAVIKCMNSEYISVNRTPGTPRWVWVSDTRTERAVYRWSEFFLYDIEVLREGAEEARP